MTRPECNENSKVAVLATAMLDLKDHKGVDLRIEKTIKNFEELHTIILQLPMDPKNNLHGQLISRLQEGLK